MPIKFRKSEKFKLRVLFVRTGISIHIRNQRKKCYKMGLKINIYADIFTKSLILSTGFGFIQEI